MIESCSRFWRAAKSRLSSRRIDVTVVADPALIPSSAVSLSTSALYAALMEHLEQKGIISADEQRAIFERALELLETDPADDGGITALARDLIDQQLPQNQMPRRFEAFFCRPSNRNISGP